jgi:aryl-alcohol dehydrogenase-like predicted oxidoreductase
VSADQVAEAQSVAPIACVQNMYNVAHRADDELSESRAAEADRLGQTPMAVASPGCCSARRTSCSSPVRRPRAPARERLGRGTELPTDAVAELDAIGG